MLQLGRCTNAGRQYVERIGDHENAFWQIQRHSATSFTCKLFRMVCTQRFSKRKAGQFIAKFIGNKNEWVGGVVESNREVE